MQPKTDSNFIDPNSLVRKLSTQSDRSHTSNTNYLSAPPASNHEVSVPPNPASTTGIRKRVNFLLNKPLDTKNPLSVPSSPEPEIAMRKVLRKTRKKQQIGQVKKFSNNETFMKNVVYNGTYPIDRPVKSRFVPQPKKVDSCSSLSELDEHEEEEYLKKAESRAIKNISMQELVEDTNVKFNVSKMRQELHKSLAEFEKFLAKGAPLPARKNVQTFAIDEPL